MLYIHVFNINNNIGEQTMAANGISTLALKKTRQDTKLAKAEAKRQGKSVAADGTIPGSIDAGAV